MSTTMFLISVPQWRQLVSGSLYSTLYLSVLSRIALSRALRSSGGISTTVRSLSSMVSSWMYSTSPCAKAWMWGMYSSSTYFRYVKISGS